MLERFLDSNMRPFLLPVWAAHLRQMYSVWHCQAANFCLLSAFTSVACARPALHLVLSALSGNKVDYVRFLWISWRPAPASLLRFIS